jgi:hypothetical protein
MWAALLLQAARVIAWTLLLAGWVGLSSLAMQFTPGPLAALGLIALWLFALGAFSTWVGRVRWPAWGLRGMLIACAAIAAQGLASAVQGAGLWALVPALLAWAMLVALASLTVRARRLLLPARPAAPLGVAACGALLAWLVLGDPADVPALAVHLGGAAVIAALVLAGLYPQRSAAVARPGCRAGLFDCSLPAWPAGAWQSLPQAPIRLASLVMLPMMCSLPWMIALCRSESMPARAVVGLHFAAMFLPGWCLRREASASACGPLLVLGGLAAASTAWQPAAIWVLLLAHGAAWSLAWSTQLRGASWRPAASASPLRTAWLHAGFALMLGAALAVFGLRGFVLWHGLVGTLALMALLAQVVRRPANAVA